MGVKHLETLKGTNMDSSEIKDQNKLFLLPTETLIGTNRNTTYIALIIFLFMLVIHASSSLTWSQTHSSYSKTLTSQQIKWLLIDFLKRDIKITLEKTLIKSQNTKNNATNNS